MECLCYLLRCHFAWKPEGYLLGFFRWVVQLASVVQKVDNTIHRINLYPLDSAIGFPNTYLLDSDLSGG